MRSFKSNENIHKKEGGLYYVVSANKASLVTLFNIYLERIMCEALDDHESSVSIGGQLITNVRFEVDIVENAVDEVSNPVNNHHNVQNGYWSRQDESDDKQPKWLPKREQVKRPVENFKYLRAIISNEGSKPDVLCWIARTTAALSRLTIIWRDKNISLASKVKLMQTLTLSSFLYACESWTLTAELERLLKISYRDHVMNKEVRNRIQNAIVAYDDGDSLRAVEGRERWKGIVATSSVVPRRRPMLKDWDELRDEKEDRSKLQCPLTQSDDSGDLKTESWSFMLGYSTFVVIERTKCAFWNNV